MTRIQEYFALVALLIVSPVWCQATHQDQLTLNQQLWQAVRAGQSDALTALIDRGALVLTRNQRDETPLWVALAANDFAMASLLLSHHADINAPGPGGDSVLIQATNEGDLNKVMFLIFRGADVAALDRNHKTVLELAQAANQVEIVAFLEKFIQRGGITNPEQNSYHLELLNRASKVLTLERTQHLIKKGAHPNLAKSGLTPLQTAARKSGAGSVRSLLLLGGDPNLRASDGRGPLDMAPASRTKSRTLLRAFGALTYREHLARNGLFTIVDRGDVNTLQQRLSFLKHGEIDFRGGDSKTALMHGVFYKRSACIKALLDHGANPHLVSRLGWNTVLLAAYAGDQQLLQQMVALGVNIHQKVEGASALHLAVLQEHAHLVAPLIEAGLNPNEPDKDGNTPLIYSVTQDQVEIAQLLMDHGADPNLTNKAGESALIMAVAMHKNGVMKLFLDRLKSLPERPEKIMNTTTPSLNQPVVVWSHPRNRETLFLRALAFKNTAILDYLLEGDFYVNDLFANGWTPLMYATAHQLPSMVKYLVHQGADVNMGTPSSNTTALMMAAMKGYLPSARNLMKQGADLNRVNRNGHTALSLAIVGGHDALVRELHHKGASFHADRLSEPLMALPASVGNTKMLRTLAALGLNPNQPNNYGWTPLMYAARGNHLKTVRWLMENEVEINATTREGWTALHFAASKGHAKMVDLLLKSGARILKTQAPTPLELARKGGFSQTEALLIK